MEGIGVRLIEQLGWLFLAFALGATVGHGNRPRGAEMEMAR